MKLTCLIIDDEPVARRELRNTLKKSTFLTLLPNVRILSRRPVTSMSKLLT